MKLIIVTLLLFFVKSTYSQNKMNGDLELLKKASFETDNVDSKKITYIFKDRNIFIKYNPISLFFGGSLFVYQKIISPQIQAGCAYDISCSNFAKQSIKKFGLLKGMSLSADRLTRCTRLSAADFHPVMINKDGKCVDHPEFYILSE